MLKDVVSQLDYSNFDEIALILFGLSFAAVCWGAYRLRTEVAMRFGSIPIDDLVPDSQVLGRTNGSIEVVKQKGISE
jgi:hypothetical protein